MTHWRSIITRAAAGCLLLSAATFARVIRFAHPATSASTSQPATSVTGSTWLDSLDAGYQQSQRSRSPIFVFAAADWVQASRDEWQLLQSPEIAAQLKSWSLVRLDPDANKAAARSLGIVSVPAMRILNADGGLIAAKDEEISADELSSWLSEEAKKLSAASTSSPGPDDALLDLGNPDAAVREAAIRKVRADSTSAGPVVETLANGKLAQRLSAMELLEDWGAPVTDIDPWNSTSLTAARLSALRGWATGRATTQPAGDPATMRLELDSLIGAPTDIEARAVRERLLSLGDDLLPLVYQRLGGTPSGSAHQRLIALRYRLVATDRLAREWPGGFDRLASSDSAVRRSAMGDLASLAKPEDHRLLRELFSDEDPFIREESLRVLRAVGGPETDKALVGLLADPELNVRAAVLKTLADSPDPALVKDLAGYVAVEKDTDLLVNAVHVLQMTPGADAFDCLKGLLTNPQWRVRGEAAEAMRAGKLTGNESEGVTEEEKAAGYAALILRLDDEEGYVASRAAGTLIKSGLSTAAAPLMKAAQHRPDVARDVLRAFADDQSVGKSYLPQIRELAKSDRADIRSAAITAMASLAPETCGTSLQPALHDADPSVRRAAVSAVVVVLDHLLPRNGVVNHPGFLGFGTSQETVDLSTWVDDFRRGGRRPAWIGGVIPDLQAAMNDSQSRVSAAIALCALGREQALPVLLAAVQSIERNDAAAALPWLPWDQRLDLFQKLLKPAQGHDVSIILEHFVTIPDQRAAVPLWDMLGAGADVSLLAPVHDALRSIYIGERYYDTESLPADKKLAAVLDAKEKATNGAELQRTAALSLLLTLSPTIAAPMAQNIYQDPQTGEWLRLDALQVLLMAQAQSDAMQTAIGALNDKPMRKVAVPFLAVGTNAIREVRGTLYLYSSTSFSSNDYNGLGQPVVIDPPPGLTADPIRSVLNDAIADGSTDLAGYAGYLLALLDDRQGFATLIKTARDHDLDDTWGKLVYRAIAKMNDDSQTAILEEIYRHIAQNNSYETREFYWTVRSMTGPNILKLRKTIRDEYGMDKLK